jgi:hypothetical protein
MRRAHFCAERAAEENDESRLGTALEMPITRELSAGKRELLRRRCARELST